MREISITETSTSPPLSPSFWSNSPVINSKLKSKFSPYDVFIAPSTSGFSVIICAPERQKIPEDLQSKVYNYINAEFDHKFD
jgi:hypothetical protein